MRLGATVCGLGVLRASVEAHPPAMIRLFCIGAAVISVIAGVGLSAPYFLARDAYGYLAAGERILAGHALYALVPGDRLLEIDPRFWQHPFLYPPGWGVAWTGLAGLPGELGLWIWMAGLAIVVSVALAYLLRHVADIGASGLAILGIPIGLSLVAGNINVLTMVAAIAAWKRPGSVAVGALVGLLAGVKFLPILLLIWMLGQRQFRAAGVGFAVAAGTGLVGIVLGLDTTLQYVREVIPGVTPMGLSPGALTGISALPIILLAVAAAGAGLIRSRPAVAYAAAILGLTFASPAVGLASLCLLAPLAAMTAAPESLVVDDRRAARTGFGRRVSA